jgi:hypothetical protein
MAYSVGQDHPGEDDPPAAPMTRFIIGDDAQRPGAGVVSVERVEAGGGGRAPSAGAVGRPRTCEVFELPMFLVWAGEGLRQTPSGGGGDVAPTSTLNVGQRYHRQCHWADDGRLALVDSFVHQPEVARPSVDVIARQVYEEVPLVVPAPHTSPPPDAEQLVGFPVWLWVDDTVWRTFDASASVAGVTVTVVAQPKEVHWDMGDGTALTCDRGTAWLPTSSADARTDCSHVYQFVSAHQPSGLYTATVTMVWSVSWSASTGESGTLPDATRSTTFELDVTERQAVVSYAADP